jgi:hypothetical protein
MRFRLLPLLTVLLVLAAAGRGPYIHAETLEDDPTLISVDETAPESQPPYSNAEADLTNMYAWFVGAGLDTLVVALDFASSWDGMHLMVAMETEAGAEGGPSDPFEFPVSYGHELLPDYIFTYKYTGQDYADLRRWNGRWEFWRVIGDGSRWTPNDQDPNKNALAMVERTETQVRFRFPLEAIGEIETGDTLRLQSYVTQETGGVKYNALDSNPQDATNDMEPEEGEWWETATDGVTLSEYAIMVGPALGTPPGLSQASAAPDTVAPGDTTLFTVEVADSGGGIGEVSIDLSPVGGDARSLLRDDGTGGDVEAGDGIYSGEYAIPETAPSATYALVMSGRDASRFGIRTTAVVLAVQRELVVFIDAEDAEGDDHGPNRTDGQGFPITGLYYVYPTQAVFKDGAFDLSRAQFMIDGDNLLIRISLVNVLSTPEVGWGAPYPKADCQSPNKAQLNLQTIDIYMDAVEGQGSRSGFPNRYIDIADIDAWEYGAAIDGWWVGFAESNGSDEKGDWTLNTQAGVITMCNDHVEDFIDVSISLEALDLLAPDEDLTLEKIEEIQEEVASWDFIITMAGHDGDSSDDNMGSLRWVNPGTSQWQFGGGRSGEGGRERDPNIIDILTIAGEGKEPGEPQEVLLNYKAEEAWERFDGGLNSCALEAQARYPGVISGTVELTDTNDYQTVVTVGAYLDDELMGSAETPPGGGAYRIISLPNGTYTVEAAARKYRTVVADSVVISSGGKVDDLNFTMVLVPGVIRGTVSADGPARDVRVYAMDETSGELSGDGIKIVDDGSGSFEIITVENGSHTVIAQGRGFARFDSLVAVSDDTLDVSINLYPAVATKFTFVDSVIDVAEAEVYGLGTTLGNEIIFREITKSLPDEGFFDFARLTVEPRDDDGSAAIFDSSATDSVNLSATLLDPLVPARGSVSFTDTADIDRPIPGAVLTRDFFADGVATFYVSDDEVEVLRVEASRGEAAGAVEVGIRELRPKSVGLSQSADTLTVGDEQDIRVDVQLLDVSGNAVPQADVGVRLAAVDGEPVFEPEIGITDANGYFQVSMYSFLSGPVTYTAQVEPGEFEGLPAETLDAYFLPGDPQRMTSRLVPRAVVPGDTAHLELRLVDRYDNEVPEEGARVDLTAEPAEMLASLEAPVFTDTSGQAVSEIVAAGSYGLVEITPVADYSTRSVNLSITPRLVSTDEEAPESDPDHRSNANVDLTLMFAEIEGDTLGIMLDFFSSWDGVHLMVMLETANDADGGSSDPFEFPINYRHSEKPDYVFTYKYSADDYADLRRWNKGEAKWEFWRLVATGNRWTDNGNDPNKNALAMIEKTDDQVLFKFPLEAVGEIASGDTLRLQAYVTQETPDQTKYRALDSNPHDQTHNMEPPTGNWYDPENGPTAPMNLQNYAEYEMPPAGKAPGLRQITIFPDVASPGDAVRFSMAVDDSSGGIGDVFVDLTGIRGEATVWLRDDGQGGDQQSGDGVYSTLFTVPEGVAEGIHYVTFAARDSLNLAEATETVPIEIENPPEVFLTVEDAIGDDHGPDSTDASGNPVDGLYYFYPTNGVFPAGIYNPETGVTQGGAFDIEKAEFMIDGEYLVIRLYVGEIPSSQAVGWNAPYPGATCTDPDKADLNLQKVDVYIDSKEGAGATVGLPFRFVDVSRSDAWEFAAAIEGWWRGLVESNGQNSTSLWTINRQTSDLDFCNNYVENYIDVQIGLEILGLLAADEELDEDKVLKIQDEVKTWDFIITLHSHDGDSNDQNFGASRWVNRAVSEWQFGGGRDGEAGRDRDANIMDILTVVGRGKEEGRTQTEMLNYLAPDAIRRFDANQNACIVEATFSQDISPPVITAFPTDGFAHNVWYILDHSPAAFWTTIRDDSELEEVLFYWRPLGETPWHEIPMVQILGAPYLDEDVFVVDVEPETLRAAIDPIELVNGVQARPFEARIEASDEYGNHAESPLFTFGVPDGNLASQTATGLRAGHAWIFYDGTFVGLPTGYNTAGVGEWADSRYDSVNVKLRPRPASGQSAIDLVNTRPEMKYLDVAREIEFVGFVGDEPEVLDGLEQSVLLALHYPTYLEGQIADENQVSLFKYMDATQRWIGLAGWVNDRGNSISLLTDEVGTYALFSDSRLSYDPGKGLSGVVAEPNPFSPNGDGIYDETRISMFVSRETDWVTAEIYDIHGQEVKSLSWQAGSPFPVLGRFPVNMAWDGKDNTGRVVPYGIYVARIEARFKTAPFNERQNIAIVVIK